MRSRTVLASTLLFFVACATTQTEPTIDFTVVDWGVYESTGELTRGENFRANAPVTPTFRLTDQISEVECRLGVSFGVRFRASVSASARGATAVRVVWEHPYLDFPELGVSGTTTEIQSGTTLTPDREMYLNEFWAIEKPRDFVPGNYSISVFFDSVRMLRQDFILGGCPAV